MCVLPEEHFASTIRGYKPLLQVVHNPAAADKDQAVQLLAQEHFASAIRGYKPRSCRSYTTPLLPTRNNRCSYWRRSALPVQFAATSRSYRSYTTPLLPTKYTGAATGAGALCQCNSRLQAALLQVVHNPAAADKGQPVQLLA